MLCCTKLGLRIGCIFVKLPTLLTNSRPMTPAPIKTSFSGTAFSERAPVDETMVSSSI